MKLSLGGLTPEQIEICKAAPDLYEACKEAREALLASWSGRRVINADEVMSKIDKALAKAEVRHV